MSVINQTDAALTEVPAGEWCVGGLFANGCAAVDGPVPQVGAACSDHLVVALPEGFTPRTNGPLSDFPAEGGGAWLVEVGEGGVLVRADGSGRWRSASWAFDLVRSEDC